MLNVFRTSYFIWLVNQICACYASSSIICVYIEYFLDEKPRGRKHLSAKVRFLLHQAIPTEAFPLKLIFPFNYCLSEEYDFSKAEVPQGKERQMLCNQSLCPWCSITYVMNEIKFNALSFTSLISTQNVDHENPIQAVGLLKDISNSLNKVSQGKARNW